MSATDRARLVPTLAAATARLEELRLHKAAGRLREAEDALEAVYRALGLERRSLQVTPAAEVHRTLGDPELVRTLSEVLAHEADLLRLEGDADAAAATARWTLSALLHGAPPGDYAQLTRALTAMASRKQPEAF